MKKLILILLFVMLSLFAITAYSTEEKGTQNTFELPANLRYIAESAFEGTAAGKVIMSGEVVAIGSGAFAGMNNLTDVYIPASVEFIADDAFENSALEAIHTVKGSRAEDWARKHDIDFVLEDIWDGININYSYAGLALLIYFCCSRVKPVKNIQPVSRTADEGKSMRPQERAELNALDYRFP